MTEHSQSDFDAAMQYEGEEDSSVIIVTFNFDGEIEGDFDFLVVFRETVVRDGKFLNDSEVEFELPLSLIDPAIKEILLNSPLIILVRKPGKGTKETDPLKHPDNIAGANFDLSPLLFHQSEVLEKVRLNSLTDQIIIWRVTMCAVIKGGKNKFYLLKEDETLLSITLLSAHCLPVIKTDTVYTAAIGLDDLLDDFSVTCGSSLGDPSMEKLVWADACTGGVISSTKFSVPDDDIYVPNDLEIRTTVHCESVYWNSIKRLVVSPLSLRTRFLRPFILDIAGVPKTGKLEVRCHYLAFIDAGVLLEPSQLGVTTCAKLRFFSTDLLPENMTNLLELPTTTTKGSSKNPELKSDFVFDMSEHEAYIIIRIDLLDPVTPAEDLTYLYELLGFTLPDNNEPTVDNFRPDTPPKSPFYDKRLIRKEAGALAVHKELSVLAGSAVVQMSQSIKRTAANRLLLRVRSMLKNFSPGICSDLEWQETVTAHHAVSRRAVTASFAPQPPPLHTVSPNIAVRARIAGDEQLFENHIEKNLEILPNHPRTLLPWILRLLEKRFDSNAKEAVTKALKSQGRNRFLLWIYGAQEVRVSVNFRKCIAAFLISVKGDYSDGVANAIGWAALHTVNHYYRRQYAAFVAAKTMRKYFLLGHDFKSFLLRWKEASGQEEDIWNPYALTCEDPFVYAAAFFLCLRCYYLSDQLLRCFVGGCSYRGTCQAHTSKKCSDVYYIRAVSWYLRRQIDDALETCQRGINNFGPNPLMTQIKLMCEVHTKGWDSTCEYLFLKCETAGIEALPKSLLLSAAWLMKKNPKEALQRAARAHRAVPGAHSALMIGRAYDRLKESDKALEWAKCAVKLEPLLSDGWAFLGYLAMKEQDVEQARAMMRTARQVGPISAQIKEMIDKLNKIIPIEDLPEMMVKPTKNIYDCIC